MVPDSQKNIESKSFRITKDDCYNAVVDTLTTHLPIKINGSFTSKQFFSQLVCLSTHKSSIHSSSKLFSGFRKETSLRHHLKKIDIDSLMSVSSDLLLSQVQKHLVPGKKYECAIDFTGDPYYGHIDETNEKYVVKGQRKKSTYKFYTYATLSIVEKNEKFTLAALPVEKGYRVVEYVSKLIEVLDKYQIIPEVICMDGGFFSIDAMKLLKEKKIPFITPAPNYPGKLRDIITNTKKQQKYDYQLSRKRNGIDRQVDITLGVLVKRIKKDGKREKDRIVYGFWGLDTWSLSKIARTYIHRFSIESSYRIRNEIKPKTSTKDATIRYLFALISFLIENIWVSFQMSYFMKKQRGRKVIDEDKFPLSVFVMLINEGLRKVVGWIDSVEIGGGRRDRQMCGRKN